MLRFVYSCAFLFWSVPVYAVPILTTSPTAPTSNLLVSHSVPSNSFAESWQWTGNTGNNHRDIGQSFLVPGVGQVWVGGVTFWARDVGSAVPGSSYTAEIWQVSGPADSTGDVLVNSQTGVLPASPSLTTSNQYWTFDIDDVPLTGGNSYAFMLSFNAGPVANRNVNFVEDFNSGYANGRWLARNDTPPNWSAITNDAVFFVQEGVPTVTPEPSTLALFGLAVGALMLFIKFRR